MVFNLRIQGISCGKFANDQNGSSRNYHVCQHSHINSVKERKQKCIVRFFNTDDTINKHTFIEQHKRDFMNTK